MCEPQGPEGSGLGWIVLLLLIYVIFNPIPGPVDDAVARVPGTPYLSSGCLGLAFRSGLSASQGSA